LPFDYDIRQHVGDAAKAPQPCRHRLPASSRAVEVVLRNGRVLRLPEGVATGRAVALADALEGVGR